MIRRGIHQTIAFGITIAMFLALALGFWIFKDRKTEVFAITVVAYLVTLGILSLICFWSVPRPLRQRPAMPVEFRALRRFGPISPAVGELLASGEIVKEGEFRKRQHVLHLIERSFPEGVWRCHAEESGGEIIAWSVAFQSIASPVLDWGESTGSVGFLISPS